MSEEYARQVVEAVARHFGIPPPNVRVGCEGCPYYVNGRCSLGYIACYQPATDTIVFSSPKYIREEVVLHELLHYVVDLKLGNLSPVHPLGVPDRIDLKTLVVTSAVSAAIGAVVWAIMDRYVLKKVLK